MKGFVESRYNLKRKLSTIEEDPNQNEDICEPTKSESEALEWLKFNKTPEPTVYKKWNDTFKLRRQHIIQGDVKLYENWPLFKQNIGSSLVI